MATCGIRFYAARANVVSMSCSKLGWLSFVAMRYFRRLVLRDIGSISAEPEARPEVSISIRVAVIDA